MAVCPRFPFQISILLYAFMALPPIFSATAAEGAGKPAPVYELSGAALIDELRKGGYVIYFRHTKSDHSQTDLNRDDLSNCMTQRNLSDEGRQQAVAIGNALRSLAIKVGTVTTSPYCRARDTGMLAFGRSTISEDLRYSIDASAEETVQRAAVLKRMLSELPPPDSNTVIVAHTSNLKEAAGIWPAKEGAAVIFRPGGQGGFTPVAVVDVAEWAAIAAAR